MMMMMMFADNDSQVLGYINRCFYPFKMNKQWTNNSIFLTPREGKETLQYTQEAATALHTHREQQQHLQSLGAHVSCGGNCKQHREELLPMRAWTESCLSCMHLFRFVDAKGAGGTTGPYALVTQFPRRRILRSSPGDGGTSAAAGPTLQSLGCSPGESELFLLEPQE
jgi:hypothetical protein